MGSLFDSQPLIKLRDWFHVQTAAAFPADGYPDVIGLMAIGFFYTLGQPLPRNHGRIGFRGFPSPFLKPDIFFVDGAGQYSVNAIKQEIHVTSAIQESKCMQVLKALFTILATPEKRGQARLICHPDHDRNSMFFNAVQKRQSRRQKGSKNVLCSPMAANCLVVPMTPSEYVMTHIALTISHS
jgi:hypothetical protein